MDISSPLINSLLWLRMTKCEIGGQMAKLLTKYLQRKNNHYIDRHYQIFTTSTNLRKSVYVFTIKKKGEI